MDTMATMSGRGGGWGSGCSSRGRERPPLRRPLPPTCSSPTSPACCPRCPAAAAVAEARPLAARATRTGRRTAAAPVRCSAEEQQAAVAAAPGLGRRALLSAGLALSAASAVQPALPAHANRPLSAEWEVVDLPVEKDVLLLDIAFTGSDPNHGGWVRGCSADLGAQLSCGCRGRCWGRLAA